MRRALHCSGNCDAITRSWYTAPWPVYHWVWYSPSSLYQMQSPSSSATIIIRELLYGGICVPSEQITLWMSENSPAFVGCQSLSDITQISRTNVHDFVDKKQSFRYCMWSDRAILWLCSTVQNSWALYELWLHYSMNGGYQKLVRKCSPISLGRF